MRELKRFQQHFPRKLLLKNTDGLEDDSDDEEEWEEWDRMQELNRIVRQWSSIWGGLLCWPLHLEDQFREVYDRGDDEIMEWSIGVWEHADLCRLLLEEVELWTGRLPVHEPRAIKILWKECVGMHYLLVQGITLLETRVSVLHPGVFSV